MDTNAQRYAETDHHSRQMVFELLAIDTASPDHIPHMSCPRLPQTWMSESKTADPHSLH